MAGFRVDIRLDSPAFFNYSKHVKLSEMSCGDLGGALIATLTSPSGFDQLRKALRKRHYCALRTLAFKIAKFLADKLDSVGLY